MTPLTLALSSRARRRAATPKLTGRWHDNATARDLAAQPRLPRPQQCGAGRVLARELWLDGASAGHDPVAADIGYRALDGHLVLYHDDAAPYWNGIVRIGKLDGDMSAVERLPEGTRVTIERTG
jgi:hypothetical protein